MTVMLIVLLLFNMAKRKNQAAKDARAKSLFFIFYLIFLVGFWVLY